jgi:hypothetical protein
VIWCLLFEDWTQSENLSEIKPPLLIKIYIKKVSEHMKAQFCINHFEKKNENEQNG